VDNVEQQFTWMYRRHYDDVARFVRRRAPDVDAADVAAEVFATAWRRFADVPKENPLPWLYVTARNVLGNELRSKRRREDLEDKVRVVAPPERSDDHSDDVVNRMVMQEVLSALPELDQEILRLVTWDGLSPSEAAKVLGRGRTAVAMRVLRLRRRFKDFQRPDGGRPPASPDQQTLSEAMERRQP
jgi:RNA polymerase sigma factor (sigma-70 family)